MIIIYLFTFPNGKHYVGRTKNSFNQRCTEHKNKIGKKKYHLYYAFQKYGWDNVVKEVIDTAQTHKEAINLELQYIEKYNSIDNGYNLTANTEIGGDNWEGRRDTEEYKDFVAKMREISTGPNNGMYGKTHSEQTIKLQKEKAKGRYTLEWFIDRYGLEDGTANYNARGKNKGDKMLGEANTAYKKIDLEEFKLDVLSGMSKKEMCKKHNLASTSFSNRLKEVFQDTSLYRIRGAVNHREYI